MSTPSVDPGRQCDGKVRHPDRRAARQARQRVGRRNADGHLTIYRCPWCASFHIGHAWADPYIVDMAERAARRELDREPLDVVAAEVAARLLGITVAAVLELLDPSSRAARHAYEYEEDPHG